METTPETHDRTPRSRFIGSGSSMAGYRRWNHHDYEGWGYYLITFSTAPRRPIFSRIENYKAEHPRLNQL